VGNWNEALHGWGNLRAISQLWAICVDQQFYICGRLFWCLPKALKKALVVDLMLIVFVVVLRFFLVHREWSIQESTRTLLQG